jgi:hypothetical protein
LRLVVALLTWANQIRQSLFRKTSKHGSARIPSNKDRSRNRTHHERTLVVYQEWIQSDVEIGRSIDVGSSDSGDRIIPYAEINQGRGRTREVSSESDRVVFLSFTISSVDVVVSFNSLIPLGCILMLDISIIYFDRSDAFFIVPREPPSPRRRKQRNSSLMKLPSSMMKIGSVKQTFSSSIDGQVECRFAQKKKSCQETNNLLNNRCPCRIECTRSKQVIKYSI